MNRSFTFRAAALLALIGLLGFSVLGVSVLSSSARAQPRPGPRPNILWISAEDLSPRLGVYGDPLARTPNLDRLAQEGVRYTRAFTTAGVCAPSRAAIITAMYQNGIGTHHMRTTHEAPGLPTPYEAVPPPYVKAFPEYLRAAGYYATNNSKTDYQIGTPSTIWDVSSEEAHWRGRPDAERPFFSVFNFLITHESRLFGDDENTTTDPAKVDVPPYYPDTPDVREELAHHYDNVAELDRQVGALLDQLEADGLADETIVVFWGDHGDGLPRAKRWLYDAGIRVPLVVRVPERYRAWAGSAAPGSVSEELVSLMGLGPTMLSLADVPIPRHMDGRAFLGPQAAPEPEYLFGARDRIDGVYDMVRSARGRRFHYIRNFYPETPYVQFVPFRNRTSIMQELIRLHEQGALDSTARHWMRPSRPPEELYDTETDPHEVNNLARDSAYQDVLARMRQATQQWMEDIDDMGQVPETQMVRRMWPEMKQPVTHAPVIVPRRATDEALPEDSVYVGPMEVTLYSPTQGASVAYTTEQYTTEQGADPEQGAEPHWKLYAGPLRLREGTTRIRAKAIRYGYAESEEASAVFTVRSAQ